MKKIDFGQTIQILANVGVIAGLIFLAIEIAQNNELLQAEARRSQLDAWVNDYSGIVDNADVSRIVFAMNLNNGEGLSDEDKWRYSWWVRRMLNRWEWEYSEVTRGYLDMGDLNVVGWSARLANPAFRAVWDEYRDARDPEFVQFVEANLLEARSE